MPRLLEIQRAVNRRLIERDQEAVAPFLADGSAINRLDIYHNTIFFVAFKLGAWQTNTTEARFCRLRLCV